MTYKTRYKRRREIENKMSENESGFYIILTSCALFLCVLVTHAIYSEVFDAGHKGLATLILFGLGLAIIMCFIYIWNTLSKD